MIGFSYIHTCIHTQTYIYTLGTQTRKKRRVSGKTRGFWQKPEVFQTSTKIRGYSTGKIRGQYGLNTGSVRV